MGMRIKLYERDPALLRLIRIILERRGHDVEVFEEHYNCCTLSIDGGCTCPPGETCADAVIIDMSPPILEVIKKINIQKAKGCKLFEQKIAVLSSSFTDYQKEKIQDMGHTPIKKPFSLSKIEEWLLPDNAED
ncbi:hypothetical protein SAMN02745165_01372 [Malonomonas rubra DSM 5091]|uniref:Response regulatory domain-containing protein n=1 Tax=Malonomonas rubra DSM 5091 TaxID=1122189 RepID=A0A1M6G1Z8_MALRU|nr:hypothetical protein [Malonomonas rubra]SHJ03949.1 hypothetical protein SAMN02745165_01372 [Malonomonas rubra DSM 5091]